MSDISGLVRKAHQSKELAHSAPSPRLHSQFRPPPQSTQPKKKRSFFSKLFCCGVKSKRPVHRRTESMTPSLPSLIDTMKTEPQRAYQGARHKDSFQEEQRVAVEVDPEDIVLSSRSPPISQVPSNVDVKIGASFVPGGALEHARHSSRLPEIEDDPAPRLNSSAFRGGGGPRGARKATLSQLEAHSQPTSLIGSPKRIGKRPPHTLLSPRGVADGRRVETVSKMEGISQRQMESSHDYRYNTLNDQTERTVGSKQSKASLKKMEERSVFTFKPHLSQVGGMLHQSSRNFLSQLNSRGGSKENNAKLEANNTSSFRPQSEMQRMPGGQVQSAFSSPQKEQEIRWHSSSALQLQPQVCLPPQALHSGSSTLRQPSYRQPHLQDALSRLEEMSRVQREKQSSQEDQSDSQGRPSKLHQSTGILEGRGVMKEVSEQSALERRILHPSLGDHVTVALSGGRNGASNDGSISREKQTLRSSGPATYRKKSAKPSRLKKGVSARAGTSQRSESRQENGEEIIVGSEEVSLSEVVISDSEGETIKQSPRGGIGSRGAGKAELATTQLAYRTLSQSGSRKMYEPRSTDPAQILPSGTERSLNSPMMRTPHVRGGDENTTDFGLTSLRSSKEEFGFYASLKQSRRGGQGLLESTNSFGPILRQYQALPSSRVSKATTTRKRNADESTPTRQSETSQEELKGEKIESASHFTPSSNKQSIESSRDSVVVRRGVVEPFNPSSSNFNFLSSREHSSLRETNRSGSVKRSFSGVGSMMGTELDSWRQSQEGGRGGGYLESFNTSRLPALLHHSSSNYSVGGVDLQELQQLREQMAVLMSQSGDSWNPLLNELLCSEEVQAVDLSNQETKKNWMKCQLFLEEQNLQLQQGYHEFEQLKRILAKENRRIMGLEREYREACRANEKEQILLNEIAAAKILECPGS